MPGSKKLRLVSDHSAGQLTLNNMISHEDIAGVTMSKIQLGNALRSLQQQEDHPDVIRWEANVSEAYRRMPMHPLQQIKQVVSFHSKHYGDQCNVFGGRASQHIWHVFMSLVAWNAVMKYLIYLLYLYVNNSFSAQTSGEKLFYKHYQKDGTSLACQLRSTNRSLVMSCLSIIGFQVNPNLMRVWMSEGSRLQLTTAVRDFDLHGKRRP